MAKRYYDKKNKSMGQGSFANMPQDVIMKEYPKVDYAMYGDYKEDNLMGVDMQMNDDIKGLKKSKKTKIPVKY